MADASSHYYVDTSRRDSRVAVDGAFLHVIPSQRGEFMASRHPSSTLESTGRGPAVPPSVAAPNVTFPLKAHVDIPIPRDPPRLQEAVPGDPWASGEPTYHQHGLHAVARDNIYDPCEPRDGEEASAPEPSSVAQREMPPSQRREQLAWLDEQHSWLEWAEISLPREGEPPREDSKGRPELDLALSTADQAIPDQDSSPYRYADDMEPARWGSDPAFTTSKFVPKTAQLSEREVTSIWEEYVATSLKPFVNVLGSPIPPNQLLIVGNHHADLGFPEVESTSRKICWTPSDSKRSKDAESNKSAGSLMAPPATVPRRGPLPPFRGGRKRPMPPRIRPFGPGYY